MLTKMRSILAKAVSINCFYACLVLISVNTFLTGKVRSCSVAVVFCVSVAEKYFWQSLQCNIVLRFTVIQNNTWFSNSVLDYCQLNSVLSTKKSSSPKVKQKQLYTYSQLPLMVYFVGNFQLNRMICLYFLRIETRSKNYYFTG